MAALTIVRLYGKPDFFITVTANPSDVDITEHLYPKQEAIDRPDLICIVFNFKLKSIIIDLTGDNNIHHFGIFGKVIAYIYIIEYQKRGLPHAHILLILDKGTNY